MDNMQIPDVQHFGTKVLQDKLLKRSKQRRQVLRSKSGKPQTQYPLLVA